MEEKTSYLNKRIGIGVVVLVLAVLGLIFYFLNYNNYRINGPVANEFAGNLVSVDGNNLIIKGFYMSVENPEYSQNPVYETEITATVSPETEFVKTIYTYPTKEELEATGGKYNFDDLAKRDEVGSFEEVSSRNGVDIKVTSVENVFGKKSFVVSKVQYTQNEYPWLDTSAE